MLQEVFHLFVLDKTYSNENKSLSLDLLDDEYKFYNVPKSGQNLICMHYSVLCGAPDKLCV